MDPAGSSTTQLQPRSRFRLRLGVGGHLALGVAAVALVVVAAHFVAEKTTRTAIEAVGDVQREHVPLARHASEVVERLAAYDRTVAEALKSDRITEIRAIEASGAALTAAFEGYRAALNGRPSTAADALDRRLIAHVGKGVDLVARAGQRSDFIYRRYDVLERIQRRLLSVGGGGLAIHDDQVFARRSLADLSTALGALRSSFDFEEAAPREARFDALLRQHADELAKSPGQNWLNRVRDDLKAATDFRKRIERFDATGTPDRHAFLEEGALLIATAQADLQDPARIAFSSAAQGAAESAAQAERTLTATGVAVLGVLLLVSVLLGKRITLPVQRLTAATRQLTAGQRNVRAPRGGSAEIDELAESFNQMADQIAAAEAELRAHQVELEERVAERTRQLHHLAHHDPLTQLPNRRQLAARLTDAVSRAGATRERFALLFVDLDNFKSINDTLGHTFGDQVLKIIGDRLQQAVGPRAFIARLGGDEFTVLLENAKGIETVAEQASKLVDALQQPLLIDGRALSTSGSVGASIYPDHARDVDALLRAADVALFRAKELGRNRFALYSPELSDVAALRFKIEQDLRRAVENNDLLLMYQPQVCLQSLEPLGVEALLRWRKPDGRIATAAEFVHVAEKTGLMRDLTGWVLRSATSTVTAWRAMGWKQATVSINVSAPQFLETDFVGHVIDALQVTGLPPSALELELTETVLQTGATTIDSLRRLRDIGVSIALDDFGIGYSSLTSIEQLPLTRVKLDRTLIEGIDSSPRSAAIARSVIGLCHGLGLHVIAEGVERTSQLEFLSQCGPVGVQGFLLAHAVEAEAVPQETAAAAQRAAKVLRAAAGAERLSNEKALVFVKKRRTPR